MKRSGWIKISVSLSEAVQKGFPCVRWEKTGFPIIVDRWGIRKPSRDCFGRYEVEGKRFHKLSDAIIYAEQSGKTS